MLTHGLGLALSFVAAGWLVASAARTGDVVQIAGLTVFGVCLIAVYAASTLYHAASSRRKRTLRLVDQICIFLMIAGTYTPFCLAAPGWGLGVLLAVWSLAAWGCLSLVRAARRRRCVSVAPFLLTGWIGALAAWPAVQTFSPGVLIWLLAGGLAYTTGVAFYVRRRPYFHAIWHVFVLAGSACHYLAVVALRA